jgi:hypothetical protein
VLVTAATGSLLSFFVFWLGFHEPIKAHTGPNGGTFYVAPVYMTGCLIGMMGLVAAQQKARQAAARRGSQENEQRRMSDWLETGWLDEGKEAPREITNKSPSYSHSAASANPRSAEGNEENEETEWRASTAAEDDTTKGSQGQELLHPVWRRHTGQLAGSLDEDNKGHPPDTAATLRRMVLGYTAAFVSGVFSALQV